MSRFFQTLNYSSQNEDWRTEAEALALRDGQDLLVITGSGDRALNPLAAADAHVVAVDAAHAQNHLLRIKLAAIRQLAASDYLAFLGLYEAAGNQRLRWAATLELPATTRDWLRRHRRDVRKGLLYRGRFERWYAVAGFLGRLVRGPAIRELLSFDDLDAQRTFLATRWDRPWWRLVWRVLCHPVVNRLFFGDPAFYERVDVPVGATIFDRMRAGLDRVLARECFMVHLVLTGRLSPHDLPPYLDAERIPVIRARAGQVQVVDGDVVDVLRASARAFDGLSLSDLPSFLPPDRVDALLLAARDATRPGGRIVVRQFLTRITPATPDGLLRLPELERHLAALDRTFSYEFLVYEVRRG